MKREKKSRLICHDNTRKIYFTKYQNLASLKRMASNCYMGMVICIVSICILSEIRSEVMWNPSFRRPKKFQIVYSMSRRHLNAVFASSFVLFERTALTDWYGHLLIHCEKWNILSKLGHCSDWGLIRHFMIGFWSATNMT